MGRRRCEAMVTRRKGESPRVCRNKPRWRVTHAGGKQELCTLHMRAVEGGHIHKEQFDPDKHFTHEESQGEDAPTVWYRVDNFGRRPSRVISPVVAVGAGEFLILEGGKRILKKAGTYRHFVTHVEAAEYVADIWAQVAESSREQASHDAAVAEKAREQAIHLRTRGSI